MADHKEETHDQSAHHEPAVSRLEKRKLTLEIKKLASETDAVGKFASRVWPMLASLLTLSVSAVAVLISISTQEKQRLFEERQKHSEHLTEVLKLATDSSGEVDRRIAGIWQLSTAWKNPDDFATAASVLTAELGLPDKDRFARCAAAEALGSAMSTVDPGHRASLARLLFGDAEGNLGLVTHQNIRTTFWDRRFRSSALRRFRSSALRPLHCVSRRLTQRKRQSERIGHICAK